jgi:ribA/ribD-fused uncharacterized protein
MTRETFTFFWQGPFSQWHPSPFLLGGIKFTHAEQFMMYAKAVLFGDRDVAERILIATTPEEQKALGRKVNGFDPAVWVLFREGVVFDGSYAKYSQNRELRESLLATRGTVLAEASPYDRVWGIGLAADDPRARDQTQWRGSNLLGKVLMRVREVLLWEQSHESGRPATTAIVDKKRRIDRSTRWENKT